MRRKFLSSLLASFGEMGGKDPVGRSLAYCYAHALLADPMLTKAILGRELVSFTPTKFNVTRWDVKADEYTFQGPITHKTRRADIYAAYNGRPLAIVEIKVEDQDEHDKNRQLEDYVRYCAAEVIPFYYITKYFLSENELTILGRLPKRLRYYRRHSEIAASLQSKENDEIAQMIVAYLEDRNMSGYQTLDVDKNDVLNFARRLLPTQQSGFGGILHNAARTKNIGQIIVGCLNNITVISEWLREGNEKHFGRAFSIYPEVKTYWNMEKLLSDNESNIGELKDAVEIAPQYSSGGEFSFAASSRLIGAKSDPVIYIWVAVCIGLYRGRKNQLYTSLYLDFWNKSIDSLKDDTTWYPMAEAAWSLSEPEQKTKKVIRSLLDLAQRKLVRLEKHTDASVKKFAKSKAVRRAAALKLHT
jgi:hypothetical protein